MAMATTITGNNSRLQQRRPSSIRKTVALIPIVRNSGIHRRAIPCHSSGSTKNMAENERTKITSKHSRFTWFGIKAYVHGGKGDPIYYPTERVTYYNAIGSLL